MMKYFYEGGPLFMGLLTVVFVAVLAVAVLAFKRKSVPMEVFKASVDNIKSLGLFALVFGMLGQFIGLFTAFELIGTGMEVSPALMAQGVKVSMITTIYGMIIFIISYLLSFVLGFLRKS